MNRKAFFPLWNPEHSTEAAGAGNFSREEALMRPKTVNACTAKTAGTDCCE